MRATLAHEARRQRTQPLRSARYPVFVQRTDAPRASGSVWSVDEDRSGSVEMDRAFGRRPGRREFGRFVGQTEVTEDLLDGALITDERQQTAESAAVTADQGVEQEHPLKKLSPEVVPPAVARALPRGVGNAAEVRPRRGALVSGLGLVRSP